MASAGKSPRVMTLACAEKGDGKLQYVSKASKCPSSRGKLVRFSGDAPVDACRMEHGKRSTLRSARKLPPPAHRRTKAGMLFLVSDPSECAPPSQPNQTAVSLPQTSDIKFCAGKRRGTLRWVTKFSKCNRLEFRVVLKGQPRRSNSPPQANDDGATTDNAHSTTIAVLANDTDADGDTLHVASVNTGGTQGNATANPDGTITYDPNHKFDSLGSNQTAHDKFKYKANDGHVDSNSATVDVTITGANHAPVVTTSSGDTAYTEGDPATAVDGALTVTDADDTNLEGGQVRISSGFQSGDELVFVDQNGISGSYNSGTGVLTLSGTSSVSNYETALRSIKYQTTSDDPSSPKQVEFKVNDGDLDSNLATKNIAVTGVNDGPTLNTTAAHLAYTEGDGAVAVDSGLTASDPDSTNLSGATVRISSNFNSGQDSLSFVNQSGITGSYNSGTGVLTLTGTTTVANYQAALRAVKYTNSADDPSGSKTVSFQATDGGGAAGNVATRQIDLSGANDAPVVTTSAGSTAYSEGDPATAVDGALTVTDADDTNLEGGQVRISSGFQSGDELVFVDQNGISGSYNSGTGVLTLSGTSSVSNYETALRSIKYRTTNDNPSSPKTVEFKVNDGDLDSNLATKNIAVTGVNDGPTLTTTAAALSYTEGDGPVAIDPGLTASDPDSANFSGATVSISSNFVSSEDSLAFTNTANITGSYNSGTGVLTLSGTDTVANYQAALRSVTYANSSDNPSGSKTVSFQASDDGALPSNVATRDIDLSAGANDAPVVTTSSGDTAYTEGDPATAVDGSLTVTDADDTNIESGQVRISSGFQSGDDLVFVDQNGISGVYNTGTGVLTLTGTASVADYQAALRSIKYRTTNDNPSSARTVEFKVNDGDVDSNAATKNIVVTGTNDAPTLNTTASSLSYSEGDGAVAIDSGLTASDPDSTNFSGATVSITGNFASADDSLGFTNTANITGSYNSGTGVLTLSGIDTVANYQAALRSVTYTNSSDNPSGSKTV
ncbi:MAG TPA: Ig-like domain-containing protein, partial [Thermoleophilaceae bacterium]